MKLNVQTHYKQMNIVYFFFKHRLAAFIICFYNICGDFWETS